jgi:hypothetical protein
MLDPGCLILDTRYFVLGKLWPDDNLGSRYHLSTVGPWRAMPV